MFELKSIVKGVGVSVAYPKLRMSSSSKRPRTELTITVKKAICSFKEKNPKATHEEIASVIGSRFNLKIGRSTVGDILRQKSHWVSLDDSLPEAKRLRPAKHVDLERALFLWFSDIRARNIPVSDEIKSKKVEQDFSESVWKLTNFHILVAGCKISRNALASRNVLFMVKLVELIHKS